jgi:hypothetical protein
MFGLQALQQRNYHGRFRSPSAIQWHRDRAGESGELPELHERMRVSDGDLDTLVAAINTRLEAVREDARDQAVHAGAAAQQAVGGVPQSPAVFESATGAAPGQAGLPADPGGDDVQMEDTMEQELLADRQLAINERQRRAGQATAGEAASGFTRAQQMIAEAAFDSDDDGGFASDEPMTHEQEDALRYDAFEDHQGTFLGDMGGTGVGAKYNLLRG